MVFNQTVIISSLSIRNVGQKEIIRNIDVYFTYYFCMYRVFRIKIKRKKKSKLNKHMYPIHLFTNIINIECSAATKINVGSCIYLLVCLHRKVAVSTAPATVERNAKIRRKQKQMLISLCAQLGFSKFANTYHFSLRMTGRPP